MSTDDPPGQPSPYHNGFRHDHSPEDLRCVYVAYHSPPFITWLGGIVNSPPTPTHPAQGVGHGMWWHFSTAVCAEHLTRLDDEILRIDEDTFEALQELEQGIWRPEYNRYYVGVEDRVRDLFYEAGMPYATISQDLRSAIRRAAERAAHRAILANDEYTPHDVEFVNGNPVVVRHFADLPTEFYDVDHLVEAEIEKYAAEGDDNEDEQKEGDEDEC